VNRFLVNRAAALALILGVTVFVLDVQPSTGLRDPALLAVLPIVLMVAGGISRIPAVVWLGIALLTAISVTLIFSVGIFLLPVALMCAILMVWYHIDQRTHRRS
jgi:hypothetical protein